MNDRKRQVLLTAQQLFVDNGFIATSIQDILDESQISKGTFYNYFSSKNECLMAILELGKEETFIRRQELLIGHSLSDRNILVEQIAIRQQVNRDHNLLPIFEAVFHSGDPDLSNFAKNLHIAELSWLSKRFIDIYGEASKPFAPDCAVLMMGMMQHMAYVSRTGSEDDVKAINLVRYTMRRIDSMMPTMSHTNDRILDETIFLSSDNTQNITIEQIQLRLTDFHKSLPDKPEYKEGQQYIQFILEELHAESQRTFLLKTVIRSFREAFEQTPHHIVANQLTSALWNFFDIHTKNNTKSN